MEPSSQERGIRLPHACTLDQLCQRFGGSLDPGVSDQQVSEVADPIEGTEACLCPVLARRRLSAAQACLGVLLVDAELAPLVPAGRRWIHQYAGWALAGVLELAEQPCSPQCHPTAVVDPQVCLGNRVEIGAGAVLMAGCELGDDCSIGPLAVVYPRVRLRDRVTVGAGAVVGRPGFGWVYGPEGKIKRLPQLGGVLVEEDVEIGALATVDSGTLQPTVLERGCKLDAHVHVGHNVRIGAGTLIAAQSGFAGSCRIGRGVLVGGQAGVADHVVVGDGARLAGGAGVIGNVPPAMTVAGYPAVERRRWLRSIAKALRGPLK